jgi:GTP-binding protein
VKTRLFVDCVTVQVRAGKGGSGCCSFRREAGVDKGGPDGGDGGRGGNVILRGDRGEDSLVRLFYAPRVVADDGGPGRGQQQHGRNGRDRLVAVPCGTQIHHAETGLLVADITEEGQEVVVARGGRGGWGNVHWKRPTHQAPTEFTPGLPGEEFPLRLELRVLADVGLVGCPNAGKSSLLRAISDAHPKVAAYPFTTLHPIVGTVCYPDYSQIRVADVPGLIAGAHAGVGLGHDFLRHVARSRVLLYVIDMAGVDGRRPWDDYRALHRELALHSAELVKRPSLVVANKMDLPEAAENLAAFRRRIRRGVLPISAQNGTGLAALRRRLFKLVQPVAPGAERGAEVTAAAVAPAAAAPASEPAADIDLVTPEKLRRAGFLSLEPPRRKR